MRNSYAQNYFEETNNENENIIENIVEVANDHQYGMYSKVKERGKLLLL